MVDAFFSWLNLGYNKNNNMGQYREFTEQDYINMGHAKLMEVVKHFPYVIRLRIKQTPELCMAAVRVDGLVLECVRVQSREICLEAVKQNGFALRYAEFQNEEILMEAVKQNGMALGLIRNQTIDLIKAALVQTPFAYNKIIKQDLFTYMLLRELYGELRLKLESVE